jgi:site-specific DNA-methyltransferase (adenine-specific)
MKLMARYKDNYFDLAIVDPPYGIGKINNIFKNSQPKNRNTKRKQKYKQKNWDIKPNKKFWKELYRVSDNQIIFGANYFIENLYSTAGWVYWNKNNGNNSFSDGEIIFTSFDRGLRSYKINSKSGTNGGKNRIHPTQKPVKLYEWLLINYAKEGDKILDTHLGSGSIAIACHNLGFDLTACEIDKDYYNLAIERINQHKAQKRLF